MQGNETAQRGFTPIELSIVLVIIGLIVGGVLVGQDLIRAAEVRATITQIEKYNTAVKTFGVKYDALPGDMNAAIASQFGFVARSQYAGEGDGNGVIQGVFGNGPGDSAGDLIGAGETGMFWVDLRTTGLIDGNFSAASATSLPGTVTASSSPDIDAFIPEAKMGAGNYIYVWSGGGALNNYASNYSGDQLNYFTLSAVDQIGSAGCPGCVNAHTGLTVAQAYSIAQKIDDGNPQYGSVTTLYLNAAQTERGAYYAGEGGTYWPPYTTAITPSSATCFDNGGSAGQPEQYSMAQNNGAGVNCALSFRMQ